MSTTYRACYWTDAEGGKVCLTGPEHASLPDADLEAVARAEAEHFGMDLSYGWLVIGNWADSHAHPAPQQPAAGVGEEIMVNTPYDVFILPLHQSGLSSGPRFVVHVPGAEQTAAPSGEAVGDWVLVPRTPTDAMLRAAQSAWLGDTLRRTTTMWLAMLAAAQQQPAAVVDEAAVWRVIAELRAYNPAADEHKGAHIHKVWAKELAAALTTQHQEPTT